MKKVILVPHIKQLSNGGYCTVASLHMIVNFYGVKISQRKLLRYFEDYKKIKDEGAYFFEAADAARKLGFSAREINGLCLDDLIYYIDLNLPLITSCKCLWDEGFHCYVVKGYDKEKERIYVNDPANFNKTFFSFEKFEELWTKHEFLSESLIVMPK